MNIDPRTVVDLLQRLERQDAEHRPHLADVAAAICKSNFERAIEATGSLYSVLESIVVTRARLRDFVVSADELGEPESLIELAIRARRIVIAMQIARLRSAFRERTSVERTRGWFTGRLRRIEDVTTLLDELVKNSCIWERYRGSQPQPAGMKEADRATMYRTSVRIAQRTMRELGADPDLVHFLRSGIASSEWLDAHIGCKQVAAALSGEIDVEPEMGVLAQAPSARTSTAIIGTL